MTRKTSSSGTTTLSKSVDKSTTTGAEMSAEKQGGVAETGESGEASRAGISERAGASSADGGGSDLSLGEDDALPRAPVLPPGEGNVLSDVRDDTGGGRLAGALLWLGLLFLTALGAYYRFALLDIKPFHHDEGVNGWFILRILDDRRYHYNPKNYHGPLLYFLHTAAVIVGGRTVEAMRVMTALFGVLAIPAMGLFRRHLGVLGVLVAAAFVSIAPVEVYFSRTAIHEIYNFTFNMTLVGGILAYAYAREHGTPDIWAKLHSIHMFLFRRRLSGRLISSIFAKDRKYLVLASVSLICLFATKETTIITVAAMLGGLFVALMFGKGPLPGPTDVVTGGGPDPALKSLGRYAAWTTERFKLTMRYIIDLVRRERKSFIIAGILFLCIWVFLFASLFVNFYNPPYQYFRGLGSFFEAFFRWGQTGTAGKGHEKPWSYFFTHLLWPYYRPMLVFGMIGLIWSSFRRERLGMFTLVWMVLATAAYSLIPYKTPWCVLSFSGPLFIGIGLMTRLSVQTIREGAWYSKGVNAMALATIALLFVQYGFPVGEGVREYLQPAKHAGNDLKGRLRQVPHKLAQLVFSSADSWTINFEEYDVKGHPFIYVQNVREYLHLINDLHGLIETAQLDGNEEKPNIVMIDAKNPMRWYLNKTGNQTWRKDFNDAIKKKIPDQVDIACVSKKYAKEAKELFSKEIYLLRRYHERPGRIIDMWVKKSLWNEYEKVAAQGLALEPSPRFERLSYSQRRTRKMRDPWSRKGMN